MDTRGNNKTATRKAMGEGSEKREIRQGKSKDDLEDVMHQDCHRMMSPGCNHVKKKPGSA